MKQFFIVDNSGLSIFLDDRYQGVEILCPGVSTHQEIVRSVCSESLRSMTIRGADGVTQVVFQSHGRAFFAVFSDQGESIAQLDAELNLLKDLLISQFGRDKLMPSEDAPGPRGKQFQFRSLTTEAKQMFRRYCFTALYLTVQQPSVLLRTYELLEINPEIRCSIGKKLATHVAAIKNVRGAVIYGGTRVLEQYSPPGKSADAQLSAQDIVTLMIYVQSVFRPNKLPANKTHVQLAKERDHEAGHSEDDSRVHSDEEKEEKDKEEEGKGGKEKEEMGEGKQQQHALEGSEQSASESQVSGIATGAANTTTTTTTEETNTSPTPEGEHRRQSLLTPARQQSIPNVGKLFPPGEGEAGPHGHHGGHGRQPERRWPTMELVRSVNGEPQVAGIKPSGAIEFSKDWLPEAFRGFGQTTALYLSDGRPYYVYVAELTEDVFYVLVLNPVWQDDAEKRQQRNQVLLSHLSLADYLERDYASFVAAKIHSHMPMLSFVQEIPGIVHFLFVDRTKGIAVVPSISALHGRSFLAKPTVVRLPTSSSSSSPSLSSSLFGADDGGVDEDAATATGEPHTTEQVRKLVFELVRRAYDHLAMGCTTMMLRTRGFHMSYRLWLEGDSVPAQVPSLDRLLAGSPYAARPHPWVVSPELYAAIIQASRAASCYELFSVYVGSIPVATIPSKDNDLLQAISRMIGSSS